MPYDGSKIVKDYGILEGHQLFPREIAAFAYDAGFRLNRLVMAVTIALAESNGYRHARHVYVDKNDEIIYTDRGIWQLHSYWHSEVNNKCAYDPACAAKQIYRITDGGRKWGQWASFTSGVYKNYRKKAIKAVINFYYYRWHKKTPSYFQGLLDKLNGGE